MQSVNTLLAVKDLMNRDIVKATKGAKAVDAAKLIADHKVSSVVIVDSTGKLIGILTEHDIVAKVVARSGDAGSIAVEEIMNPDIHIIAGDSSIFEARAKMAKIGVKHMIVEVGGKPAGLISSTSLLGG